MYYDLSVGGRGYKHQFFIKANVEFYSSFYEDLKNECHPDDMKSKKILDEVKSNKMEDLNSFYSDIYFSPMVRIKSSLNDIQTRYEVVRLIAKIRSYELYNNKLPTNLSELFNGDSKLIPKDLNSREEIKYSALNREIVIKRQPEFTKTFKF